MRESSASRATNEVASQTTTPEAALISTAPGQVPEPDSSPQFDDLMVRVAWLYHRHDWTQEQISKKFGVSRTTVARLLQRALQEGLVTINFAPGPERLMRLEEELGQKYDLAEIILVPFMPDPLALRTAIAKAVAAFLERWLEDGIQVGVSTSRTLNEMGDYFSPSRKLENCVFIEMLGGIAAEDPHFDMFNVSWKLAAACHASAKHLLTPAVVSSCHVRDALLQDERVAKTLEQAAHSDVALIAIGSAPQDVPVYEMANLSEAELSELGARGAVGEIMGYPYNVQGQAISHPVYDRVIGLDLEQVRKIPFVIAVAGGKVKELSVLGALRQRFIKVLITDEQTGLTLFQAQE
jgi:DNA-binding transcriptional regulator LsrR (DeoR family)